MMVVRKPDTACYFRTRYCERLYDVDETLHIWSLQQPPGSSGCRATKERMEPAAA